MFRRILNVILVILIAACIAATVIVGNYTVRHEIPVDQAQKIAADYMDAMCSLDGTAASKLSCDADFVSAAPGTGDEIEARLYSAVASSYAWEPAGECIAEGSSAYQTISLTYADVDMMLAPMSELIQEYIAAAVDGCERSSEVYNESFELKDEVVSAAYKSAFEACIERKDDCLKTEIFTLELVYDGEKWLVRGNEEMEACFYVF